MYFKYKIKLGIFCLKDVKRGKDIMEKKRVFFRCEDDYLEEMWCCEVFGIVFSK